VQGQDIILFITVHSAQVEGEDRTIGSTRVPLRAGLKTQKWFELSSPDLNAHGGALELSISYVGIGNPHHVEILTRRSKMVLGSGMGAAEGPMENIEIPATLVLPMDTESFPELSDMSEGSPLPSLPSTSRSPVYENQPRGMSPTIKGPNQSRAWDVQAWAEADMYVRTSETDKERPSSPGETPEAAPQDTLQSNPKMSSFAPATSNRICLDAGSYRQLETTAIPAASSQASVLKLTVLEPDAVSESASTHAYALTYDGTPANLKPTHEKMQCPQSKTSELIRSESSNSGAGTNAANKEQERRKDWEEMFEMRAEMDGIFSHARHLASPCRHLAPPGRSPGHPWSERKIGHHSRPTPHQQQTMDNVIAKLHKAELDLMVTKEELAVEQGKRIKADETCTKHLDQIANMAEQLKEEQNTVSKLKNRVSELERCTSTDAVAQERRQLRFSRFLAEFVLACLLDKLRSHCYSRSTLSESCDEQSGSYTTAQTMGAAECMKLRRECADDLKSLMDIMDVMNGLVSTRDNAARCCIDRAQQSIVASRHALSLLQHALAETEREMEGIRQDLQALHDEEQSLDSEKFRDSLEGVSHIQQRSVSLSQAGSNCAFTDRPCLGIDSMQAQISSLIDNVSKTEHELRMLSKFFEQKDRTSNGVLASFIHSKHAGEAGWSVHASEPWDGMRKCHASCDAELSVTDHHKLIRELDSVLLAELCSSRRLQPPQNSVPEHPASVDRRISPRPVMPTVEKALPFNPTRTWTNFSEAKMAVTKNHSVDDLPRLSVTHTEGDDHVTHVLLKTGDQGVHVQEPGQGPTSSSQHAPRMYCPALEDANETEAGNGERRRFFSGEAVKRTDIYDALSRKYSESLSTVPKGYTEIAASSGNAHAHFQYA